jgi:hypothetical protein
MRLRSAGEIKLAQVKRSQARAQEERTALRRAYYLGQIPDSESDESDAEGSSPVVTTRADPNSSFGPEDPRREDGDWQWDGEAETASTHSEHWAAFNNARRKRQRAVGKDDPDSFTVSDYPAIANLPTRSGQVVSDGEGQDEEGFIGRDDLYLKLDRRVRARQTRRRVAGGSGIRTARDNLERKGRGVIDHYVPEDYRRSSSSASPATTGPASGHPHPTPDPLHNPPLPRTTGIRSTTTTWRTFVEEQGRLELSRVNAAGTQEWLSAIEISPRVWEVTSSTTLREGPT